MRSKRALKGTMVSIAYEVVALCCGLILPRMILEKFGSEYNGLTASITQFLSCVALLKAGIGGVTKAALYKPLAENDIDKVSAVINATQVFIRKIAFIFLSALVVFASIYPILVRDSFSWLFSSSLVLILGISTFFQYYFGITYGILIEADQKIYVVYSIQILTTIMNTIVAALLLKAGCSIHVVKLGSAIVYSLNPVVLYVYVNKHYHIKKDIAADSELIKHRWDAFAQEVAFFIHNNTDIMVLTVLSTMWEVSVYTVYNFVIANLRQIVVSVINPFGAAFGDMLARNEAEIAQKNLRVYETVVFFMSTVLYSVAVVMIVPFIMLYTENVGDTNYARPLFAVLLIVAGAFSCYRIPYKTIVDAAGHFRQMRNGALIEAGINIIISVIAVSCFGLVGVAIGTVVATVFRATQYAIYLQRTILPRRQTVFFGRVVLSIVTILLAAILGMAVVPSNGITVIQWIIHAFVVTICVVIWTVATNWVFYRQDTILVWNKLSHLLKRG